MNKLYESDIRPETVFMSICVEANSEEEARKLIEAEIEEFDGAACDISGTKASVHFHDMEITRIDDLGVI